MPPNIAFQRFTHFLAKVVKETAARAPDWKYEAFEELAQPFLDSPETREIMTSLGVTRAEMVTELLDKEEEILTARSSQALVRLDPRSWLWDLGRSLFENVESADEPSNSKTLYGLGLIILVVFSVSLSPSLILLYLLLIAAGLAALYAASGTDHLGMRFVEPFLGDLRGNVVVPLLRAHLNDLLRRAGMDEPFQITDSSSLTDLSERKQIVATSAMRVIERTSSSVGSGSIGVSGPRGAGKTTLLKNFCENRFAQVNQPDLRILIPAPVHYEARDFVIHVFGHLCEAVIANTKKKPRRNSAKLLFALLENILFLLGLLFLLYALFSSFLTPGEGTPTADDILAMKHLFTQENLLLWSEHLAIYFAVPTVAVFAAALFSGMRAIRFLRERVLITEGTRRIDIWETITPTAFATIMSVITILVIARWVGAPEERFDYSVLWTPYTPGVLLLTTSLLVSFCGAGLAAWRKRRRATPPKDLASLARERLRQLRYLETTTIGFTGSIQVTRPAQLSGSRTRALAEQQMGLPQLVAEYRNFATMTAEWWSELHKGRGRLVVGIDEIDKMSAQEAEQFINQVKALFGTPNCLTLVSVSDDALANFEQRSFSVRDSFDTAFDDIVRVEPLSYEDVRQLLTRRISGIPDSLVALCYVLSGGLPRECLRVARRLVQLRAERQSGGTEKAMKPIKTVDFAEELVRQEVEALKNALLAQGFPMKAAEEGENTGSEIDQDIRGIFRADWPKITGKELLKIGSRWWEAADSLAVYSAQFLFLGAVLLLYTDTDEHRTVRVLLREQEAVAVTLLTTLARARAVGAQTSNAQRLLVQEFLQDWEQVM
ncbi:hypothetical protein [Nocardiopsis lucentensis]|uniref:hypothetical protein n=1 Tax=Nocardiopsis lucentensis TaxID=53441 RepID=UPI00034AFBA5|nr:hypothetical protein [Nocardiopsis lucentensis]